MDQRTKLIVVGGPTASGKTRLAIELAQHYGTEIISGDSRQFYREMSIGNARPNASELAAAPHHFIADRSVTEPLAAGRFAAEALELYQQKFTTVSHLILVGGSGLFLRAFAEGLDEFPAVTNAARSQVQSWWDGGGLEELLTHLNTLDPNYAKVVDRQNQRRVQRALEVSVTAGLPYSSFLGKRPQRPFQPIYLTTDLLRPELYDRINRRVDLMLEAGLQEEVKSLSKYRQLASLQTVGYREWWPYFAGEYDLERTVELIKQNSRRYAKRQVTWFKKDNLYAPVQNLAEAVRIIDKT
ncbi:tRNA (adenosine(37)-N6)-dimethylallyltransferase MiaA [Lewinella sp. 4G2]|uniref:tRNA (adenosine(37)-N6)-dimethylallyltransferase MiaA n=1 Tax=Lewinella sp. 4G2 TaxID=1803372 RepID=UPI0007B4DBB1|nr:tRNA (adenosine(37)-N6)-dimethylallyltransferase MiaA [Lewinella sp. 4G2]OAV45250.1 tRNA (adenosine(37)-N6)-dimethylallyltransferase MiaA [Lewinella sp. 4G2]